MRTTRVAVYRLKPNSAAHFIRSADRLLSPVQRGSLGFLSFELIDAGHAEVVSISTWRSYEAAHAATPAMQALLEEHLGDMLVATEEHRGSVALRHLAATA